MKKCLFSVIFMKMMEGHTKTGKLVRKKKRAGEMCSRLHITFDVLNFGQLVEVSGVCYFSVSKDQV